MDITYHGHNCFRLMERGMAAVVIDPTPLENKLRADIVTLSVDAPGYNDLGSVKGDPMILRGPGEYEIGGVFITGVATWNPDVEPEETHYNTVYVYNFGKSTVCHLGTLDYVPTQQVIEALGNIDVLLAPVGGGSALNSAEAAEVISRIEPGVVIPMHFAFTEDNPFALEGVDKFLREMGVSDIDMTDSYRVSKSGGSDGTEVVVLEPK